MRTLNAEEKPSKIANITFAISLFYQKKKSNWMAIGIYCSWWNHQMRTEMVQFEVKNANLYSWLISSV